MRLLFHYSAEKVAKDKNGNIYISGNFTQEVWDRYLDICDYLDVVLTDSGRIVDESEAMQSLQKIDTSRVHVHLVPDRRASIKSFISPKTRNEINRVNRDLMNNADFVIVRIANNKMNKVCRKAGKPYAIEVVGCPWDAFWNHGISGKILAPYMFLFARREVKKAKWVLYVTNEFLQKRYPTRGKSIACSNVSLNRFDEKILQDRIERIQTYGDKKIIIGTAAALDVHYKGQQYILEALSRLKKQGNQKFIYQVVGGGDSSYLRTLAEKLEISDQFEVIGQLSHDKVFEWLNTIDIYAQPSLQEGLPRSVIEAMSYGVPCMGSSIAGIPELINEKMLFKPKSVKGIADILESLDKDKMIELAKENFEKSKEYDVVVLKERRQNFYREFRNSVKSESEEKK